MRDRESASLTATDSLRLDLFWRYDRYAHRIVTVSGVEERLLVESVDGCDEDNWPPSPPLQQLSVAELQSGRQVALLVGMAGKSHWSVSIEPQPEQSSFMFDVACRSGEPASRLGSTYQASQTGSASQMGFKIIGVEVDSVCSAVKQLDSKWFVEPDQSGLRASQTIRWKYAVSSLDHSVSQQNKKALDLRGLG